MTKSNYRPRLRMPGKSARFIGTTQTYAVSANGRAVALIRVEPVPLELSDDDRKEGIHNLYQGLFDMVDYPITLYSRQSRTHVEELTERLDRTASAAHQDEYLAYVRQLSADGIIATQHLISVDVPVPRDSFKSSDKKLTSERRSELDTRVDAIGRRLKSLGLRTTRITGDELYDIAVENARGVAQPSTHYLNDPTDGSSEVRRMVYVTDFPEYLPIGWPADLFRTDGLVGVIQTIRPRSRDYAIRKLERTADVSELELHLARSARGTSRMAAARDDSRWMIDLLTDGVCSPVDYAMYIVAHGPTDAVVDATLERVIATLRGHHIRVAEPVTRNDLASCTDSLAGQDALKERHLLPSSSAAAGFPFVTERFTDTAGVLYGLSSTDGVPVILDRWSWDSYSMAVLGALGSGKSYAVKLELARMQAIDPDIRILTVDPKCEYGAVTAALGGTVTAIGPEDSPTVTDDVQCFQPAAREDIENAARLADVVETIYGETARTQRRTLVVIDEAHNLMVSKRGRTQLRKLVLESRDLEVGLTLISQSASHFLESSEGTDILKQLTASLLMKHLRGDDAAADFYKLSPAEAIQLENLETGGEGYSEGILRLPSGRMIPLEIRSTRAEHEFARSDAPQPASVRVVT